MNKELTVGEDVMQWAEKGWLIDKFLKGEIPKDDNNESFSYDYFREVFIKYINENISERLNPEPKRPEWEKNFEKI